MFYLLPVFSHIFFPYHLPSALPSIVLMSSLSYCITFPSSSLILSLSITRKILFIRIFLPSFLWLLLLFSFPPPLPSNYLSPSSSSTPPHPSLSNYPSLSPSHSPSTPPPSPPLSLTIIHPPPSPFPPPPPLTLPHYLLPSISPPHHSSSCLVSPALTLHLSLLPHYHPHPKLSSLLTGPHLSPLTLTPHSPSNSPLSPSPALPLPLFPSPTLPYWTLISLWVLTPARNSLTSAIACTFPLTFLTGFRLLSRFSPDQTQSPWLLEMFSSPPNEENN